MQGAADVPWPTTPATLKGGPVAARIIAEVRAAAEAAIAEGFPPRLVSITVGDADAVDVYVRNQRAKAAQAAIGFDERRFPRRRRRRASWRRRSTA